MKKSFLAALGMIIIMVTSGVVYYNIISIKFKELPQYGGFLVPEKAEFLEENGDRLALTTDESSEEGLTINYRAALKKEGWSVVERYKGSEYIWTSLEGEQIRIRTQDHKIIINHYDNFK